MAHVLRIWLDVRDLSSTLPCLAEVPLIWERQSPPSGGPPLPNPDPSPPRPPNPPRFGGASSVWAAARGGPRLHISSVSAAPSGALSLSPAGVVNPLRRKLLGRSVAAASGTVAFRSQFISARGGPSRKPELLREGSAGGREDRTGWLERQSEVVSASEGSTGSRGGRSSKRDRPPRESAEGGGPSRRQFVDSSPKEVNPDPRSRSLATGRVSSIS